MPPGKHSTSIHVLRDCSEESLSSKKLVRERSSGQPMILFNRSVHVAILHLDQYVHSCFNFICSGELVDHNALCGVVPPETLLLKPGKLISVAAVIGIHDGSS